VFALPNPRIDWSVLDWNEPALALHRSVGARPMSGWTRYRLEGDALAAFAQEDADCTGQDVARQRDGPVP
jgi:hypothetical protein